MIEQLVGIIGAKKKKEQEIRILKKEKPDHGHLERGLEREMREQDGVVGELGSEEFGVEKLLAFGQDVSELADSPLQLANRVVATNSDSVLFAAPFHRQRQLLLRQRRRRS